MYLVNVDHGKCDGCEECSNICPSEVFKIVDGKSDPYQASDCAYCLSCVEACPNSA
ncbi:MAG TPA: 4Fe-4S binding protein, partial [Thermodesulfovibrionia bacterium]|nr:4Fe-4S binding protein [Thermodesulfovibrionia bacterium]